MGIKNAILTGSGLFGGYNPASKKTQTTRGKDAKKEEVFEV